MSFDDIIKDLKGKIYKPIYFLMGDESYFIDKITDYIAANVLSEEEKSFNQTVLYGKDTEVTSIIDAARRYPMMAPYQVIIVKEAQNIRDIEKLSFYAENPLNSTILVVNYKYKTLDKRKKLGKLVSKQGVLFESKKLYDNQVPGWIANYLKQSGLSADPKSTILLSEYLGNDLSKIVHEIDKLKLAIGNSGVQITAADIEKNIGISKDYNNFELQKAVLQKDVSKVNKIVLAFGKNPKDHPIQVTISTLFNYFIKLLSYYYLPDKSKASVASALRINPFFVADYQVGSQNFPAKKVVHIISLLREYDMKSKGFGNVSADNGDLLKELMFQILF